MKQIKRLTVDAPKDAYGRAQRGLLRSVELSEAEFRALERAHGDHIAVDGEAVLIAQPHGYQIDLHYAFPDRDSFSRQFPPLFARIASAARTDEGALGYRLKLRDAPSRPYVEPVLLAQAFEATRYWWRMTLDELPQAKASDAIAAGFVLRPAGPNDAEAIAQIDEAAFSTPWLTPQEARGMVREETLRVLEEIGTKRAVAYLRLRADFTGAGYISDVAVHPEYQRRGLGEAMLRWSLAWFRAQGYRNAALTVSTDNGPAIALYRKLGLAPAESGIDYRRPVDEEEVRQVFEKRLGSHIRVRRRY